MGDREDWAAVQGRLDAAERDLAERERLAAAGGAGPDTLAELAAEWDRLADDRDQLALLHDQRAKDRDALGVRRDELASQRDRQARDETDDSDPGLAFRFLSARDRDDAVGDRADALVDPAEGGCGSGAEARSCGRKPHWTGSRLQQLRTRLPRRRATRSPSSDSRTRSCETPWRAAPSSVRPSA